MHAKFFLIDMHLCFLKTVLILYIYLCNIGEDLENSIKSLISDKKKRYNKKVVVTHEYLLSYIACAINMIC